MPEKKKEKTAAERNEELLQQEKTRLRLSAIQSEMREISDKAKNENRDFTDDEKARWERTKAEFDRIHGELERDSQLQEMDARVEAAESARSAMQEGRDGEERGFNSFGEMVREVAAAKGQGQATELRDMLISVGSSGGFLIPPQFQNTILSVDPQRSVVRSRATVIPAGDPPDAVFEIPYFDSESGDIEYTSRKESGTMDESDPKFGLLKLQPTEKSTYVEVSKKTLENAPAVSAFLERRFNLSKQAKEDYLFINGSGEDEPQGIINSPAKISVSRNTSADIKFVDISSMLARQLDMSKGFWMISQSALPKIVALTDSAGNSIFIAGDVTKGISPSLLGFPIVWTSRTPALGTEGDISFLNLDYYLIKDGSGPYIDMYDVQPKTRMLIFTSVWNVDGQVWLKSPLTREDGVTYSPIVTLEA